MKKIRLTFFYAFLILILLAFPYISPAQDNQVKIGVLAKRGSKQCLKMWSPTAEYLSSSIPGKNFIIIPIDFEHIYKYVEKGKVDFILANSSFYVELESLYGVDRIATLKNSRLHDAFTMFGGVIFCGANRDDIKNLRDLKGKTFMAVDETSFGGWRMTWRELKDNGIDPYRDFKELNFGGTHDAVVYAVAKGEVDAGTVRTDTLERMQAEGKTSLKDFYIINQNYDSGKYIPFVCSTRLYPEWPMAKVKHTSAELAEKVAIALLSMTPASPAAKAAKCAGWTIPLNYQSVHDCLMDLGIGPYKDHGEISSSDVIRKYWTWILVLSIVFMLMAFSTAVILRLNRKNKTSNLILKKEVDERRRAEEKIKEQNTFLNTVIESLSHPFYVIDAENYAIKLANSAAGLYSSSESPTCFSLTHKRSSPCDGGDHVCPIEEVKRTKKPVVAEHIHYDKQGTPRIFEVHGFPIFDSKGDINEIIEYSIDITERKKAEKSLKKTNKSLENILKSSLDCIVVTDSEGKIILINNAFAHLTGYMEEELLDKTMSQFIPRKKGFYKTISDENINIDDGFIESSKQAQLTILKQGKLSKRESFIICRDGKLTPVEENIAILHDEQGTITGAVWSLRDIIERKNAERNIKGARDFLESVIESSTDGIIICNEMGNIISANSAMEKMCRFTKEDLIGRHCSELLIKDENVKKYFIDKTAELFEKGHTVYEANYRNKDGNILIVECTSSMIKDEKGNNIAGVSVIRDISERKRMEERLQQAQKMEAIGTLSGGIAHDFNNILASIIGYTEMTLLDLPEGIPIKGNLEQVIKSSMRARDLVKQILAFSRKTDQKRQPMPLYPVIKEAVALLRASLPSTIEIREQIKSSDDLVLTNPTQIHQLIMNLCANASHAMEEKGGILEICLSRLEISSDDARRYHSLQPGPHVKLTVSDTGTGIHPEVIDRIFDPFFTTKGIGKGTGLGLSVVHGIVKSNGGDITVNSKPGSGTSFNIILPAVKGEYKKEQEKNITLPTGSERILFVDDENVLIDVGKKMFESLGYKIIAKTSSIEALEVFKAEPDLFDLVITDYTMPNLTGYDLAIKIMNIRGDIPVILCTGFSENVSPEKAKEAGIKELVMKPIRREEIATIIRNVLDNK